MKIGIYPGSFNPWHEGHTDVLLKALKVFDKVVVAIGQNPDKQQKTFDELRTFHQTIRDNLPQGLEFSRIEVLTFQGLLADFANDYFDTKGSEFLVASGVIRGLRNGQDLEFERTQQYWNEDLGMKVPTVYFVCDRKLSHISSSAIRAVAKIKG